MWWIMRKNFDRRIQGWLIIDQGWMGTINWWMQGIFEIKGRFENKLSKDWSSVGASESRESTCIELLLMHEFNFIKPSVKSQGIHPHVEHMPPWGCIAWLFRRQLVDEEFLHHNVRIRIDDIGILAMRSVDKEKVSVGVLDFLVLPFYFFLGHVEA